MKIIYLHQYFNTPDMAGGTRSYEMARRLVAQGHEVHMITSGNPARGFPSGRWRQSEEAGIHVHWVSVAYDNKMGYLRRLRAFFEFALRAGPKAVSLGGDIVFATSTPLTIALPAVYASWRLKIPMVFEVRDMWPDVPIALGVLKNPLPVRAALWLEKFAYRHSSQIVALAPGMGEKIVAKGYPAGKVHIIPNGADFSLFRIGPEPGMEIRRRLAWLGDRPLITYIGTVGPVTNVGYLAQVAAEAWKLDPDIRFAVVGDGKDKVNVRKMAGKLGVLDRNFFMFDAIPKRDVPVWLSATDLAVILISGPRIVWQDSVNNKFFDALAAGRPVANNFEGWSALLARDYGAGLILDSQDHKGAAETLVKTLRDRAWLNQAGRKANELGRSMFDRDMLAEKLEAVLMTAVRNRR